MMPERSRTRANPARGLALIATAVVLGILVLRNGWDDATPSVADGIDLPDQAADGGSNGDATATTAAPPPARPPEEVTVRVLNASGVGGAAAGLTDLVAEHGHPTEVADNAPAGTDPATTVILFADGYQQEAANLAVAISSQPEAIAPLAGQVDPGAAQLVVLLGQDVAANLPG